MIRISEKSFNPGEEVSSFEKAAEGAGAIVSFIGKVRGTSGDNDVTALQLEHYPGVTERSIRDIAMTARERWAITQSLIIHRVGTLKPSEPIVLVCVAAAHRREAFEAADYMMDYLKTKALFWKKEIRGGQAIWIEPRDADYEDAARWREDK